MAVEHLKGFVTLEEVLKMSMLNTGAILDMEMRHNAQKRLHSLYGRLRRIDLSDKDVVAAKTSSYEQVLSNLRRKYQIIRSRYMSIALEPSKLIDSPPFLLRYLDKDFKRKQSFTVSISHTGPKYHVFQLRRRTPEEISKTGALPEDLSGHALVALKYIPEEQNRRVAVLRGIEAYLLRKDELERVIKSLQTTWLRRMDPDDESLDSNAPIYHWQDVQKIIRYLKSGLEDETIFGENHRIYFALSYKDGEISEVESIVLAKDIGEGRTSSINMWESRFENRKPKRFPDPYINYRSYKPPEHVLYKGVGPQLLVYSMKMESIFYEGVQFDLKGDAHDALKKYAETVRGKGYTRTGWSLDLLRADQARKTRQNLEGHEFVEESEQWMWGFLPGGPVKSPWEEKGEEETANGAEPETGISMKQGTGESDPTTTRDDNAGVVESKNGSDPEYGDANIWPGKMGITEEDLLNLGLMSGTWWKKNWRLDQVFRRFRSAPPKVIELLVRNLTRPKRAHKKIRRVHQNVNDLINALMGEGKEEAIRRFKRIMNLVGVYSNELSGPRDDAWSSFAKALRVLHNEHYPSNRWGVELREHREPYPDVALVLIHLARFILIQQELYDLLPESSEGIVKVWRDNLGEFLKRREIQSFLKRQDVMRMVASVGLPKTRTYGWLENDSLTRDFLELVENREFLELVEQFSDIWQINASSTNKMKRNREPDTPHLGAKHAFLRQFPDGRMQSPLAELDYYCRIAMMILEDGYALPDIIQPNGTIRLASYNNPLLEPNPGSGTNSVQPVTINLGGNKSALLLSGPNMGGKTTTARGIGLAILLTQMGFPIPADDPEVAVFRNIYTLFPSPEQLRAGYGYFGMLIERLTTIIKESGPGDLVILDEVPTGTDYYELVAIATVLIEDLINKGATVVVTGHIKKAFEFIAQRTGQQPFMHTISESAGHITPDFGLVPGVAKHSHAIELMAQAGFDDEIVQLARKYYETITEKGESSDIPTNILSGNQKVRTGIPADGREIDDVESIKTVVSNLYSEQNFAFPKTQKSIIDDAVNQRLPEEEASRSLHYTEVFVAQGADYLRVLTDMLSAFTGMPEEKAFWAKPEYDQDRNAGKIQHLEEALNRVITHLELLRGEDEIGGIITAITYITNEVLPDLRDQYSGKDLSDHDVPALDDLQTSWQDDWNQVVGNVIQTLSFLDRYAGIGKGVIAWELRPPRFSKKSNTFSLKDSRPLFPNRGFLGHAANPFVENAVPQTFEINPDKPVMVLTGPNSSGKTVMMFNSRVNALLAINGFYVSGDLEISRFDSIHAFFGGMNETETGESYFLNILGKYASMVNQVTPDSLVILDELHGTDNFELAAIQVAILHYLRSMNCTVIFNTHIRDGLKIANEKVGLDFWQTDVEYDSSKNEVNPLYTLSPDPNLEAKSYGLAVAKKWLSPDQITRAEEILSELENADTTSEPATDAGVVDESPSDTGTTMKQGTGEVEEIEECLVDNSIDPAKLEEFINAYPQELQELIRFIAGNISYVDQEELERTLRVAIEAFKRNCKKPFIVYAPGGPYKSNYWVYRLARRNGLPEPLKVFSADDYYDEMEEINEWSEQYFGEVEVVYIDDAGYSGNSIDLALRDVITKCLTHQCPPIHFVIPYMSRRALEITRDLERKTPATLLTYEQSPEKTRTIGDFFEKLKIKNAPLYRRLWPLFIRTFGDQSRKNLLYFQHKVPDCFGTLTYWYHPYKATPNSHRKVLDIFDGGVISEDNQFIALVPFKPPIDRAPYHNDPKLRMGYKEWVRSDIMGSEWEHRLLPKFWDADGTATERGAGSVDEFPPDTGTTIKQGTGEVDPTPPLKLSSKSLTGQATNN
ncbi:MAG: hypothetical protein HQ594_03605, partial [Candidatus Omnitrophica bacterium]|nr:hypothetical protein [Candidatus Omnitrophota bacterium]